MSVHPTAANLMRQMWPKNQREQKAPKQPKGLRRRAKSDPSRATRSAVKSRAQMRCERCAKDLTWEGGEIHHLKNRSQGGGHELTNLALLCLECHGWATAHPHAAHEEGFTLWHGEQPGSRPILSQLHGPVYLLANGGLAPAVWPPCRRCSRPLAPGFRFSAGGDGPYHLVCGDAIDGAVS
ncbi:HNH endonuclease [Nocardia sp. NPDC049149]|uniref:HNH endonuclease n=1 Tax=Nocardia sp. NPDC049149 TaxID=3364315 RepID=UPI0037147A30